MGWMWASKSQAPPATPSPTKSTQPPPPPASAPSETTTDPELAKFLALFQEDTSSKSTSAPPPPPSVPEPPSQQQEQRQEPASSWFSFTFPSGPKSVSTPSDHQSVSSSSSTSSHPSSATSSSSLTTPSDSQAMPTSSYDDDSVEDPSLPSPGYASLGTDISCRNAFDYAFHCNSIGGQWTAVYRHGSMQSCSGKWGDFWFCMRMRSLKGKAREDAIRQYYREKEEKKYLGQPSSEDVWEPRKHLVKEGVFLTHPLPQVDEADDEWNMKEIARRKELRDKLGLGPEKGTHAWAAKDE